MTFGSLLSRAGRSFFSREAYREAARDRTATCVVGLAIVVSAVWVADTYKLRVFLREMRTELTQGLSGMPDVHIEHGEARLDPPGRFIAEIEGKPFIVLDPEMTAEEALASEEGAFLTRTHVFVRSKGRADTRNFALSSIGDVVVRESDLERWSETFLSWFPFVWYPLAVAFSLVWRLVIAAGCAAIGLAIARVLGAGLDYAACFRVATLALVPTLVIGALASISAKTNWWETWMGGVCTLAFLAFGIAANRGPAPPAQNAVAPIGS